MSIRISEDSPAGRFFTSQGVSSEALNATKFRVLNWQAGDALTVVWPFGRATVFARSRFLETGDDGELEVSRRLPLLRHELFHVQQGLDWGFAGYWARHLWARVRHFSISAKSSSVEAPAYVAHAAAHAALDELGVPR
jgi:hypothetical protein